MAKCIRCGRKIGGRKKFCDKCKKAKKREYFRKKYNNDDDFRAKHLKNVKVRKSNKLYLGSLGDYSAHARSNFEDEERVVKNIKNRTFNARRKAKKDESFGYKANKNYDAAKSFEEKTREGKVCEICGGTDHVIENGMIICNTCGLCEDVFSMSALGKPKLKEDGLTRALRAHFKEGDNNV